MNKCRRIGVFAAAAWFLVTGLARGAEVRDFVLAGTSRALSEASSGKVIFCAMPFNDLTEQWNVDVAVTNTGSETFSGLIVLTIDGFTGTSGPLRPDGVS